MHEEQTTESAARSPATETGSVLAVVPCTGNFCRSRGATLDEMANAAHAVGAVLKASTCMSLCLLSPVVKIENADGCHTFSRVHGTRAGDLLRWISGGQSPTGGPVGA